MSARGTIAIRRCVRLSAFLGFGLALALGVTGGTQGALLLKDSFGLSPVTAQGGTRFDAAGNFVGVFLHTDLSGLRAEFPFTSNEVWTGPGGRGVPTWGFSVSSPDPFEQYGTPSEPTPQDNGTMSLVGDQTPLGKTDELIDFSPPAGAFQMSLDVVGGGPTTAIGFTSSMTMLYDNFETFGQIWMVLHGGQGQGGVGMWELHTNGLSGPSLSGTTILQGFNPLAISYDPATHSVRGSVNGVPTAALSYTATGIGGVGFEGQWTVNNFIVQTGAIQPVLAGDYNGNGVVDAADYTVWRDTLGQVGGSLAADGNHNGSVDVDDYGVWQSNFGGTFGGGALARGAVPEPASIVLLAVGALGLCMVGRRQCSMKIVLLGTINALVLSTAVARAGAIPGINLNLVGGVAFDRDNDFGWHFTPNVDVNVTALGIVDVTSLPGGSGTGLTLSHDVGIFQVSDQSLVTSVVVPAGTAGALLDHFRYQALASSAHLTANTLYEIAAFVPGGGVAADDIGSATGWTLPAEISYSNPAGVAQYFVSAKGTPPPTALTFAGLPQTGILPTFSSNFLLALPPLLPDYNGNGIVDAADYTVWRDTLAQIGAGLAADGNGNGRVDVGDYDWWTTNFGSVVGGGALTSNTVPEPSSGLLLLITPLTLLHRRGRRGGTGQSN